MPVKSHQERPYDLHIFVSQLNTHIEKKSMPEGIKTK